MSEPLQFALLGLGLAAAYSLAAQGIVVIYRGAGVVNFAHGGVALIGAGVFYHLWQHAGWPVWLSASVGVMAGACTGVAVHFAVMRPLRNASPIARLIATLGILTLIERVYELWFGTDDKFVPPFLPTASWRPLGGAGVGEDKLLLFGGAVAITLILWLAYRRTKFGILTTAVAEQPRIAGGLGYSPDLIAAANWAIGGALAALAGILLTPLINLGSHSMSLLVIPALAAALVGGFKSFPMTALGATAIGVAQSEMARYVTTPGWSESVPFIVVILVLAVRGRSLPLRSHLQDRLPAIGTGRISPIALGVVAIVGVVVLANLSQSSSDAMTTSFVFAIVCLSLVVVTGFAGQVSLAQFAFAGAGAFVASKIVDAYGVSFPVALALGMAAAIPVGVIIGLPALRTRGATLAVVTLGLALTTQRLLLENADLTGGLNGLNVGQPTIFGWNIADDIHPQRYAVVVFLMFLVLCVVVANLRRGATGRRLIAVRSNERAAASLGISIIGMKLYAFALSAVIAAAGGVLLAFRDESVVFTPFDVFASIYAVMFAVIGGIGYVLGAAFGAILAPEGLTTAIFGNVPYLESLLETVGGELLVATLLANRDGLVMPNVAMFWNLRDRVFGPRRVDEQTAAPARPPKPTLVTARRVRAVTLEAQNVTVRFGGVVALSDVSIRIPPGCVTGLIGPNGAGKTTIIDALTGFTPVSSGSIVLDGMDITRWSAQRRARGGIARSFQSLELFDDLTVADNLRVSSEKPGPARCVFDLVFPRTGALGDAAERAIDGLGLLDTLDRRPGELSYGRRRLVAIARALAADPAVLLLDEPAAGLDRSESAELGELIRRVADQTGLGVLLIEHDVPLVMKTCDHVVAIDFGRQIASGAPSEVARDKHLIAAYLGEPKALENITLESATR